MNMPFCFLLESTELPYSLYVIILQCNKLAKVEGGSAFEIKKENHSFKLIIYILKGNLILILSSATFYIGLLSKKKIK